MTRNTATAAPPKTAAPRYSQHISLLVDTDMKAYTVGVATLAADAGGYTNPKEGEEVRELLAEAIAARYESDPKAYAAAVARGRRVLAERAAEKAAKAA